MQPQPEKNIPDRCLQDIFCERFNCRAEEFEKRLFWMCVRPNVIFLARMMWVLNRKMFYGDLEMLRQLGRTTNTRELRYELESFRHYHPPRGFLRRDLKVRVSGRRLLKIASRLFGIEATRKARSLTITTPTLNMPGSNSATKPAETTTAPTSNQTSPGVETTATQKNI